MKLITYITFILLLTQYTSCTVIGTAIGRANESDKAEKNINPPFGKLRIDDHVEIKTVDSIYQVFFVKNLYQTEEIKFRTNTDTLLFSYSSIQKMTYIKKKTINAGTRIGFAIDISIVVFLVLLAHGLAGMH